MPKRVNWPAISGVSAAVIALVATVGLLRSCGSGDGDEHIGQPEPGGVVATTQAAATDMPSPSTEPSASAASAADDLDEPYGAIEPLEFSLVPSTCSIFDCADEASGIRARTDGFTPNATVNVNITTPDGRDANELGGEYRYDPLIESTSSGTVDFSYWWKKWMDPGGYRITLNDRATGREMSTLLTFTAPELRVDRLVADFVCDHKSRDLVTISGFVPGEAVDYSISPPPTEDVRKDPVDDSGTKTIRWYCEEKFAPQVVTYTVHALGTGRELTFDFNYVRPEDGE